MSTNRDINISKPSCPVREKRTCYVAMEFANPFRGNMYIIRSLVNNGFNGFCYRYCEYFRNLRISFYPLCCLKIAG